MKTLTGFLALALLTIGIARADVSPKIIGIVKRTIVSIGCLPQPDRVQRYLEGNVGTGFFVDKRGDFITAQHIIQSLNSYGNRCGPVIFLPTGGWENEDPLVGYRWFAFDPTACMGDKEYDVSICRVSKNNPFEDAAVRGTIDTAAFETAQQPDGTDIAFSGIPYGYNKPVTIKGSVGNYSRRAGPAVELTINSFSWRGTSGSPVYTDNGKVIGVMVEGEFAEDYGLSIAEPATPVVDLWNRYLAAKK